MDAIVLVNKGLEEVYVYADAIQGNSFKQMNFLFLYEHRADA